MLSLFQERFIFIIRFDHSLTSFPPLPSPSLHVTSIELNLAPSDVLEALNRLLDDNKELLIPETGETVRPLAGFSLFATQNPPGAYGGRKPLSRAFRNRFLELNISDLPSAEVEEIVTQSCGIAPKFSKMMVAVMIELQTRRQQSSLFQGKYGAVTTRDLIKWGRRQPQSAMEVAEEGYMLLAEKLRSEDEKRGVEEVLNTVCKVKILTDMLYEYPPIEGVKVGVKSLSAPPSAASSSSVRGGDLNDLRELQELLREGTVRVEGVKGVAITASLRRLWRLGGRCVAHNEPVLLIGETGCGKTMGCQLLATHRGQRIRILNCHQSTEVTQCIAAVVLSFAYIALLKSHPSYTATMPRSLGAAFSHPLLHPHLSPIATCLSTFLCSNHPCSIFIHTTLQRTPTLYSTFAASWYQNQNEASPTHFLPPPP
jgi:MoxR-like ATPase